MRAISLKSFATRISRTTSTRMSSIKPLSNLLELAPAALAHRTGKALSARAGLARFVSFAPSYTPPGSRTRASTNAGAEQSRPKTSATSPTRERRALHRPDGRRRAPSTLTSCRPGGSAAQQKVEDRLMAEPDLALRARSVGRRAAAHPSSTTSRSSRSRPVISASRDSAFNRRINAFYSNWRAAA